MKKFFSYILTFVVMFVISAASTVFMSYAGSDGGINPMLGVGGQGTNSSFFTGLIGTFEEEQRFSVEGIIEIERDGNKIPVSLYVNVDISDSNNLKIDGFLNVKINDTYKTIEFSFYNNTIYLSFNGIDIKVTTATIETLVLEITNLISTETDTSNSAQEDNPSIIEELMPKLMSALNDVEEKELENGDKNVKLEVEGLAKVEAVTTSDGIPKSIKLQTAKISGVKITADINMIFNKELVIFDPEYKTNAKDYFDLKQIYKVVENLTMLRNFNAVASVKLGDGKKQNEVAVGLLADIDNGNIDVNLLKNTFGYVNDARATLLNGETYFKVNDLGFYLNNEMMQTIPDFIKSFMDMFVEDLKTEIDTNLLSEKLDNIVSSLSIEKIFELVKVFRGFSIDSEGATLILDASVFDKTQGRIEVNVAFDNFNLKGLSIKGLNIEGQTVDFSIELEEVEQEVEVLNKEDYLDIYNIYQLNKDYFKSNALSFDLTLNEKSGLFTFDSNVNVDIVDNYYEIVANLAGEKSAELFVLYDSENAYLSMNDIKLRTTSDFINSFLGGIDISKVVSGVKDTASSVINNSINDINFVEIVEKLKYIKNISITANGIILEISGDAFGSNKSTVFVVTLENSVLKSVEVQNLSVSGKTFDLQIGLKSNVITKTDVDNTEYLDIETFVNGLKSTLGLTKGSLYASANLTVQEKQYLANLVLSGDKDKNYANLLMSLSGAVELNSEITYKNNKLYVGLEDLKVSASEDLISKLIGMISSNVNIDTKQFESVVKDNKVIQNVLEFIKDFTLNDINKIKNISVTSSHISVTLDKEIFGVDKDLIVRIELYKSEAKEFEISNLAITEDIKISLKVSPTKNYIEKTINENDYLNVDNVIDGVSTIVNANNYRVYGTTSAGDVSLALDLIASKYNGQFDLSNSYYGLEANIFGDKDVKVSVVYDDSVAYVSLNNIKLRMSKTQAKELIEKLGIDNMSMPKVDTQKITNVVKDKFSGMEINISSALEMLENIKVSGTVASINLGDLNLEVCFNTGLITSVTVSGLNIDNNIIDITANLEINHEKEININKAEYLDVVDVVNKLALLEKLREFTVNASVNAVIDGKSYIASIDLATSLDKEYVDLVLALTGETELDINAIYKNGVLYANIEDIFVSVSKDFISNIISKVEMPQINVDTKEIVSKVENVKIVNNIKNFINGFDINSLTAIKEIIINNSFIEITIEKTVFGSSDDVTIYVEFINNEISKISVSQIEIDDNISVGFDISLERSLTEKDVQVSKYLNIDDVAQGIDNLINFNSVSVLASAKLEGISTNEEHNFNLEFDFIKNSIDNFDIFKSYVYANANIDGRNISIIYKGQNAFVTIDNIKLRMSKTQAEELIEKLGIGDKLTTQNINVSKISQKANDILSGYSIIDILKSIKALKVSNNDICVEIDGSMFGIGENIVAKVAFENNVISLVSIEGLEIEDTKLSAEVNLTINQATKKLVESYKYLDVLTFVNNVIALQNLREATVNASVNAVVLGESYFADIYFSGSLEKEYAKLILTLNGGIELDLEAVYKDDVLYAGFEDIFVKANKGMIEKLFGLVDTKNTQLDTNSLIDINSISLVNNVNNFISQINIDSLKVIKELVINANEITVTIDKSVFGSSEDVTISVIINKNNVTRVIVSMIDITEDLSVSIDVSLEQTVYEETVDEDKYLDVEAFANNVIALKDLNEATISAFVDAQINGKDYNLDLDFVGSLKQEYLKAIIGLSGEKALDVDVRIVDNVVYLGIRDIWLSIDIDTIKGLVGNVNVDNLSTDGLLDKMPELEIIDNIKNFVNNFELEDIKLIKNITINSSVISVELDKSILNAEEDILIQIDIVNSDISKLTINNVKIDEEISVSVQISLSKQIVIENIEKNKYLSVEKFVSNLESYINANLVQLLGDIRLYEFDGESYNETLGLSLDLMKRQILSDLMGYLKVDVAQNGSTISLETNYLKDTIFAKVEELKVRIEKDGLKESVHTILEMIGIEPTKYDSIIDKVTAVLNGENIMDVLGANVSLGGNQTIGTTSIDIESVISAVLDGIKVNASGISINIDGNVFGFDSIIDATISMTDSEVSQIVLNKLAINDLYIDASISLAQEDKLLPEFTEEQESEYLSVAQTVETVEKVYETIKNGVVSGDINVEIELFGEVNTINIIYGIKYQNNKLSAYIQTNFKGLDVNVYLIDGVFYFDIVGMKFQIKYKEFNDIVAWLNSEFNLGLNIDFNEIEQAIINLMNDPSIDLNFDLSQISSLIKDTDFSFLDNVIFGENSLEGSIAGTTIFVVYDELVRQVTFRKGTMFAELNCTSYDDFTLKAVNKDEYSSYTILIDAYDSVVKTLNEGQYSVDANAKVIANQKLLHNINIDLDLDILNDISMYADVAVDGTMPTKVMAAYQNEVLYANYENLKLSIHQYNLREILVVVLEALGIDASTISFLGDVAENMEVSTENISNLVPALDFGNPLNMLKMIKAITLKDNVFNITLDGKSILNNEKATDMNLNVKFGEGISYVELLNIYTGQENGEIFNLIMNFKDFNGVPVVQNPETYIDISNSSQLIKAFVNTSNLNDYTVTGNLKIVANIIGINIDMDVPVLVNVKIVDGEVVVYAKLDIPVVGSNVPGFTGINVNNDVPYEFGDTSVKSRMLELMIKDGFVYMYRKDVINQTVFDSRVYEKQLKISTEEFSWGLTDYLLSYGVGLSDQIMAEIDKAFDKAVNRGDNPLDISNVLLGYNKQENANVHQIVINLREIANNELMDKAAIDIHIINNSTTANKDYIGKLVFDMNMPLASGVNMNIKTDDLSLVDIGKAVDMSYVNNFANSYAYKENQQYERSDGGAWEFVGEKKYTIRFVNSRGDAPADIVATVDSAITLPTLSTIVQDKEDGKYTYTFAGWYTTESCKEGTKFTSTVMPRGSRTLYAKWNETIVPKVRLSFNSMGGEELQSIYQLVGSVVVLPTPANKIVVDGQVKITYGFTGWFTDSDCQNRFASDYMPNEDTTLYAGWKEIDRYVAYNLKVIDNGTVVYDEYVGEGTNISLSGFNIDSYTQYYLEQNFSTRYTVSTMPSNDLTLYVRNRYALNIVSVYGSVYDTTEYHYQGDSYTLPSQKSYTTDDGNTRVTYTFNGYDGNAGVMPNANHKVVANWTVVTKHYYTVTFELAYNANAAYHKYATLYKNGTKLGTNSVGVKVLEGTLNLNEYSADWKYTTGSWIFTVNWWYDFYGFSTSKDGSTVSSVNITGNTTIYGVWSGLKSS
ncbi:MAG: InlB B-repeat-containing protein [Clostridia bacterium]|nr:InlB B-repeat-containing protein [Clostridia bacterium]